MIILFQKISQKYENDGIIIMGSRGDTANLIQYVYICS